MVCGKGLPGSCCCVVMIRLRVWPLWLLALVASCTHLHSIFENVWCSCASCTFLFLSCTRTGTAAGLAKAVVGSKGRVSHALTSSCCCKFWGETLYIACALVLVFPCCRPHMTEPALLEQGGLAAILCTLHGTLLLVFFTS